MQFKTLALSFFIAAATAQSVDQLVAQIPKCAVQCIAKAAESIGCSAQDVLCQCKKADELTAAGTQCVATSCTDVADLTATLDISTKICAAVAAGAASGAGSSASAAVSSATAAIGAGVSSATAAIGSATSHLGSAVSTKVASATGSSTAAAATPTAGAIRNGAALGLAAAAVALAL